MDVVATVLAPAGVPDVKERLSRTATAEQQFEPFRRWARGRRS